MIIKNSRLRVSARRRWDGSLSFSLGLITVLVPALAGAQVIRADGRTATTVSVNGVVTDVRTTTVQGPNAFNSFAAFNVPLASTTNLHVPTGAANLINLVREERSSIDGALNAIKDGRIGGNVWFVNPYGLIVGARGTVNVGSLNVITPALQFVDNFFMSSGVANPESLSSLLNGSTPVNPGALVSIQGKVNAIDGVNLSAGTVSVGGTVFAGARFLGAAPDFTDVVNANGIASANNVLVVSGRIRIVAEGDVTVGGMLATPGATGVKGGEISIRAGGNVDVQAGAQLIARGNGANSAGGQIISWAGNNAVNHARSLLDASAGASGNGGFVEFSAKNTVELAGGELRADGTGGGVAGSLLIDPANIYVTANILHGTTSYSSGGGITVNGADLTLKADTSIDISANTVISSRSVAVPTDVISHQSGDSTAASGNITLEAPSIVLHNGSALLAQATNGFAAGDITLKAEQHASSNLMGSREATSTIQIGDTSGGATLRGKNVSLNASTTVDTKFYYTGDAPVEDGVDLGVVSLDGTALGKQAAGFGLSLLGINVVHSQSKGTSSVVVQGTVGSNSVIEGTVAVSLLATNNVSSGVTTAAATPGAQVATPLGLGALYASAEAIATVDVQSTATIKGGDFSAVAHNDTFVEGTIKSGTTSSSSNQLSIAFGYTSATVEANANVAKGATIQSTGMVNLDATNYSKLNNTVESVTGPNGQASAAVAWSNHSTTANASLLADISDAKQVHVIAVDHVLGDQTSATASAGVSGRGQVTNTLKQQTVQGLEDLFWKRFGMETQKIDQSASPLPTPFRIGGAIAYVDSAHSAKALIGDDAKIHVSDSGNSGAVLVAARTIGEKTVISAETTTSSPSVKAAATPSSGDPSRIGVAAGLAIGNYTHTASAVVGKNAEITADKIAVTSEVKLPIRPSLLFGNAEWNFDRWDDLSTIKAAVNTLNFLDVMNGKSSASVSSSASPESMGFSGSANILNLIHTSQAEVREGAKLNVRSGASGGFSYEFTMRDASADHSLLGVLLQRGAAADVQSWTLAAPVTVQASTDSTLLFHAGAPALATSGSNTAIGFALNQIHVTSTNESLVRENVAVRGVTDSATTDADGLRSWALSTTDGVVDDVRVTASSAEKVFSFGANAGMAAGGGNSVAINGIISRVGVDNRTTASVDNEASVAARELSIGSNDGTVAWSIAGAFNLSSSTAVGIGLAINDVTTDTRAEIADNDSYALIDTARASQGNYTGAIMANDLDVQARTSGRVEAIGIVGAVSNSGAGASGPGSFDKAGAAYRTAVTDLNANILGLSPVKPTRDRANATTTKAPASAPPTFGLSGAGSGAVNLTHMATTARIDGATVDMTNVAGTAHALFVRAVSDSDITTASGSAALTRANNPSQTRAVGMSGAIAVNMVGNSTEALIKDSTITGAKDVSVQALTGGEQLSVAIAAAVTTTPVTQPSESSQAVAGSVSITLSQVDGNGDTLNFAKARIENSSVSGDSAADADLHVTAYNRTFIGTGGGSLSAGGKSGVGAAVTFTDVRNNVDATVAGSTIKQFQTATVEAYNATEIGAGGAVLGYSGVQYASTLAGAFVLTRVQNQTNAAITGNSSVTVAGQIDVLAKDSGADNALETLIDPSNARSNVAPGLDYCGRQAGIGASPGGSCITSVAGVVQANTGGTSSNVGISFVQNLIGNTLSAKVENSVLNATDTSAAVNVTADSSMHMLGLALGAASADKFSGAGSVVVSQTENKVSASVTAPAADAAHRSITAETIHVRANDGSSIESVAGQVVNSTEQAAIGAAITYNDINNQVVAKADGVALTVASDVLIEAAENNASIRTLAVAGALTSEQAAITASIAVNQITNQTKANLQNATTAGGAGGTNTVKVWAHDDSSIKALAGSVAAGKQAGAGAAFAYNAIKNETQSEVSAATVTGASKLDVWADQTASIQALTAAAGASGSGSALAGSASVNLITNDTTADLLSTGITGSTADVHVRGHDTSTINAFSGGAALAGGGVGVGIAASINRITNTVDAHVSGTADADVLSLLIDANSDATIDTIAVALGVASDVGVGGSNATNLMGNTTKAYIADGARVLAENNVGVFTQNDDRVKVIAGAVGASPDAAGAGVSVVVNIMDGSTDAYIDGTSTLVDAKGTGAAVLTVNSGELASPLNVNSVLTPSYTHANLSETELTLRGLAVTATSHQSVITNAASLGVGSAAGASLVPVLNILGGTTRGRIDNAKIGTRLNTLFSPEVYVNAASHTYAGSFVIGAAGGAGGAATAAAASNLLDRKTDAYISNAITGGLAAKDEQISSLTDSAQRAAFSETSDQLGDSSAPVIDETTTVTRSKTLVPTLGKVRVKATASQSAANVVAGFAVGAGADAGTGVVNRFHADTQAHVDGGSVSAGSLEVKAETTSGYNAVAGAGAGGGVAGAAASFVVGIADNTTKAWVGAPIAPSNTTLLSLTGDLAIKAKTSSTMNSLVVSGAGAGAAGIAGMADVTLLNNTTVAGLYRTTAGETASVTPVETENVVSVRNSTGGSTTTTTVTRDRTGGGRLADAMGNVSVDASENVDIGAKAGALAAGGAAGVGAGANIVIVKSQVTAEVENSKLTTPKAVSVSAGTVKDVGMFTAAAAAGGTAGIGGAVGLLLMGDGTAADASSETDKDGKGTVTQVNNYSSATPVVGTETGLSADEKSRLSSTSYDVAGAVGSDAKDAVTAKLDASTIRAGSVSVNATGSVSTSNTVGAGGAGTVGIGGAVGYTRVYDNIIATATGSMLNAPLVTVSALMQDNTDPSAQVKAYVGSAGLVGIGAGVADGIVNNTVKATLGGTVTGGAGTENTVTVSAQDLSSVKTEGLGFSAGAAAVGVVVSIADKSSHVSAQTQTGSHVTQYKTASIIAEESGAASSKAIAAAGGLLAGTGAGATAYDRASVIAQVNGTMVASGAVNISASATPTAGAKALGVTVGGFSVGASVALATAAPTVTASVGNDAVVNGAGSLVVTAAVQVPIGGNSVESESLAGAGGTLVGANATVSKASSDATVSASVGDGVTLTDGDLMVAAVSTTKQVATTTGVGVGYIALGANVAEGVSSGSTQAWIGTDIHMSSTRAGAVTVKASGVNDNTAEAVSGAGGMFAGNAATATTTDNADTKAWIAGANTRKTLYGGDFMVNASHQDRSGREATSVNASAVGASGALALHSTTSTVEASLGDNLTVNAVGVVQVEASNTFTEDRSGDTASGAAGGGISGAAVVSRSALTGATSSKFGNNVIVNSGTDPVDNAGGITVTASTMASANDQVTLATGGAITGAGVESTYTANFGNDVTFGTGNQLTSQGSIGAGTWAVSSVGTSALVSTWGLASVGVANATTDITANQHVAIGAATSMAAFGNINVTAGKDPLGSYDTALNGDSNAQGYVRGIIAVPDANASTRLANNASVNVASGAQLNSGQNVVLGAYSGAPMGTSSAEGRGYQLYFIPVTSGSSSVSTPTTSEVDFNGAMTAGVYHNLDIRIDDNTLTVNPDAAPFLYAYNSNFSAPNFIAANFSGTQAQLLNSSVSQTEVGAFTLGTLYASGGTATINADTVLKGSGTVTSYGAPTISVVNNSANYLLLNSVNIPNLPGGKVNFTGAKGKEQALTAGLSISEVGGSGSSGITINNAYTGTVGDGAFGPALLLLGAVENLGGVILVNNSSGSLGQTGTIYGQQVTVKVPNGVAVISPTNGLFYAGSNPYSEWQMYMVWPGGNPALGVPNATEAMTYVINAEFNADGQYTTADALTGALIGSAGSSNNVSTVYFGNCAAFAIGDCSGGTADRLSLLGLHHDISGDGGSFAKVPVRTLTQTGSYAQASLSGSASSSQIYGGQVSIVANTIDVNGKISAGRPTQWSIDLPAGLTSLFGELTQFKRRYDRGLVTNPVFNIPGGITRVGDSAIKATYNAQTNEISVEDVRASSGGGYVGLTGHIISTNTLGNIHVNGGLGDVQISNKTGLAINLNKINTGNTALASALVSEVEIIDTNRDASANHTLYWYTPGTGMRVYSGAQSQSKQQLLDAGVYVGSSSANTTFDPVAGMRWEWAQTASLSRPFSGDLSNWTSGNWTFTGNQNDPWMYTDKDGRKLSTTPKGYLLTGQTEAADFRQRITGASASETYRPVSYKDCNGDGECNYGFKNTATPFTHPDAAGRAVWQYRFPTKATLTVTSSVKASNPFAIDFSGNSQGSVAVSSNGSVVINNALVNPNGNTTIATTRGDLTESATGSILTNGLSLTAPGGIGSTSRAMAATLTANGELSAIGGSQGIYLDIDSAAKVKTVRSQTGSTYGDVVIRAADALTAVSSALPNITGNNITLSSARGGVGSESTPMVLNAHAASLASGLLSGGVVKVSGLNDIGITQTGGDLLIGSIESTAGGNVYIHVPNGTIYGAAGQTAAQALSDDQVQSFRKSLRLTAAYGAETGVASDATVVRFQNQVNSAYQQYWRLLGQGTATGTSFTLAAASLPTYRPLAAAALGVANPTDAQVQGYANDQYRSVTASLASLLGANWSTDVGASRVPTFAYAATQAQIDALTARAVWTEAELNSSIKGSTLKPGTPVGIGAPNITGRDIKLVTSGAIGKLAAPVNIKLADLQSGNLTPTQAAALAIASGPGTLTAVDDHGAPVASNVQPDAFEIQQTAPVFVNAAGHFTSTSGGLTFVQTTAQNISLDKITAGGNVSVTAPQSILNAGTSTTQIVTPGDVTLLAGSGNIGSAFSPLSVHARRLLSASAGQDAYLRGVGGDLILGRVAAGGMASLDAVTGSLVSFLDGVVVDGGSITLNAVDDVGTASRYVLVHVGSTGTVNGLAGGSAYIEGPTASSALHVGTYSADAGLHIVAVGDLTAQQLQSRNGLVIAAAGGSATFASVNGLISTASSGDVSLTAVEDLTVGAVANSSGAVSMHAGNVLMVKGSVSTSSGVIDARGASVDIATGGELVSDTGAITVSAMGNVYVNRIVSGKTNGQAITVTSTAGRIVESDADAQADVVANGTGALVTLIARDGIGDATRTVVSTIDTTTPRALQIQVAGLEVTSSQGAVHLGEVDDLAISSISAQGKLQLTVGGALTGLLVQSTAGSVGLSAATLNVSTVEAATSASITSTTGALQVGSASARGLLSLRGKTGITATSLSTSGPGGLTATAESGDLVAGTTTSGDTVTLAATRADVKVDTVQGQNDVTITAGQGIAGRSSGRYDSIQSLAGRVKLQAQGGDILGKQTQGAGNVQLTASRNVDLSATQSTGGALEATAQTGTVTIGTARSQAAMTLSAQTGLTADTLSTSVGSLQAVSTTGDLVAGAITSADAVTLTASAADVKVDTVQGQNDVTITAGQGIAGRSAGRYDSIQSLAGQVKLQAQGGDILGKQTQGAGNVQLTASRNVDLSATQSTGGALEATAQTGAVTIGTARSQAAMTLSAQTGLTADTLSTSVGSLQAVSTTGDLVAGAITSADAVTLTASAANVKVDTVQGQNDVAITAGQGIAGRSAGRYDSIQSLAGQVKLQAQGGDILGNQTHGAGNVQLTASRQVGLITTWSSGGSISAVANTGDLLASKTNAQVHVNLRAGGSIAVGDVVAATGNATVSAQGNIVGDLVGAAAGDVTVDSANGQVNVKRIVGDGVLLYANDAITGGLFEVRRRFALVGNSIDASVQHTSGSKVLQASLEGRYQPAMSLANLTLNSSVGVSFDRLWALDANLKVPTGTLEVVDGYIRNRLLISNPMTRLLMDNSDTRVQGPVDLQLYSRTKSFDLLLDRNIFRTHGADIIHRNELDHTVLSESTGLDFSVAEQSIDEGVLSMLLMQQPVHLAAHELTPLLKFGDSPVLFGDTVPVQNDEKNDSQIAK